MTAGPLPGLTQVVSEGEVAAKSLVQKVVGSGGWPLHILTILVTIAVMTMVLTHTIIPQQVYDAWIALLLGSGVAITPGTSR